MTFEQVRDVLDHARKFHESLHAYYAQVRDETMQEKVRMLLDHLGRREKHLQREIEEFESRSRPGVLNTWLQYTPDEEFMKSIRMPAIRSGMSCAEIVYEALQVDEAILKLFRHMAELVTVPEARDVFMNLYEHGKKEREQLVLAVFDID